MKDMEYYDRMAKDLYNKAYSDGYSDGVKKSNTVSTQEEQHIVQEPQKSR